MKANKYNGCKRTNTGEKSTTNQSLTLCTFSLGTQCVQSYQGTQEGGILFFFWDETDPPPPSDSGRWSE